LPHRYGDAVSLRPCGEDGRLAARLRRHPADVRRQEARPMRTDAMTIQPIATADVATDAPPGHALGARAARWLAFAATVLATTTAVLLACGLAVVMHLS
jgi:hypothetical protein